MSVSRQTVSRWKSDEVVPELAKLIGWNFPFVTQEQQNRFGLHGYVASYVLPEGFETQCPGVQYMENAEADYAVITVREPFVRPFERIQTLIN